MQRHECNIRSQFVGSLVAAIVSLGAPPARDRRRGRASARSLVSLEGARRLSFDADVLSLLPRDGRVIQAFRTFLARFGSLDQLYVVFTAPEGHAIAEYADEIDAWVDRAARARPRSRASTPASSIARAISAGSPTVSCCVLARPAARRGAATG